jgi:hypothetical protein
MRGQWVRLKMATGRQTISGMARGKTRRASPVFAIRNKHYFPIFSHLVVLNDAVRYLYLRNMEEATMPNTSRFCLMAVLAMAELWAQSSSSVRIGPAVIMGDMNNYSAGLRFKRWRAGHLIAWDKFDAPGKVGVYNASLQLEKMAALQVDGAQSVSIVSADMTRHGEIVASGVATQQDGAKARFLAVISSSGSGTRMVRTEPYLAQYICAADDGSVWTVGEERTETGAVRQSGLRSSDSTALRKGCCGASQAESSFMANGCHSADQFTLPSSSATAAQCSSTRM